MLGRCRCAVYLLTASEVVVLATPEALRLPCAVIAPVLPQGGPVVVGDGRIGWPGASVSIVREWAPTVVPRVTPSPARAAALRKTLAEITIDVPICHDVDLMIGRGSGLTPSGDDVLAGFLLGCRAFGVDAGSLPAAVLAAAPRTSALSAALLRHAVAGRCLPQFAAVAAALNRGPALNYGVDGALAALLRVGHTSGAALAHGLALAAGVPVAAAA